MNSQASSPPPNDLVALSHAFGGDSFVIGGGGNISWKDATLLWIKPSGVSLAGLRAEDLVPIDRAAVGQLYTMDRPGDATAREALVSRILGEAVHDGSGRRPSVETPLHDSFRAAYVLHTHPPFVNGLTCAALGERVLSDLFPGALWMPRTDPGYSLAIAIREALSAWETAHAAQPDMVFLQNHGLVVAGETAEAVRHKTQAVIGTLQTFYRREGVRTELIEGPLPPEEVAQRRKDEIRRLMGPLQDQASAIAHGGPFSVAEGPLTPDHIVYHRAFPFVGEPTCAALDAFREATGYAPVVFACPEAVYATGASPAAAERALSVARDGALIDQLAAAAGGVDYMDEASRRFVETWEAEQYRRKVAADSDGSPRDS